MPVCFREVVNPSNVNMRYKLWSNGLIEPAGTQPPPEHQKGDDQSGYGTGKMPLIRPDRDFVEPFHWLVIYNWNANPPTGHVGDKFGRIFNLGAAPEIPENTQPVSIIWPNEWIIDAAMNPAGDGTGYALSRYGNLYQIGGATNIADQLFVDTDVFRKIYMPDWTTKKYVLITAQGQRFSMNGALAVTATFDYGKIAIAPGSPVTVQPFDWLTSSWEGARACAFYNNFDSGGGDGWLIQSAGYVWSLNDAQQVYGEPQHEDWLGTTDINILDNGLSANPLKLLITDMWGNETELVVSTPPVVVASTSLPANPTTNTTRPTIGFVYGDPQGDAPQAWQFRVLNSAQYGAGGTDEVQRVTITGTPTGGTFKLTFQGQQTATIAYNATAANVQTALEALTNVEVGDVTCTGGPLPGSFVTVTFAGALAKQNLPQMSAQKNFTGGSSPAVTVTTTTQGVMGIDPAVAANTFSVDLGMPEARTQSSFTLTSDLPNATYRAYARAQDTSGLWSPWAMRQWVQNVTIPATPTLSITPGTGITGNSILVSVSSVAAGAKFYLEYRDSASDPWRYAWNGFQVTPSGTSATIVDTPAPVGIARTYRAKQLTETPWLSSLYSSTSTGTPTSSVWTLVDPDNPAGGQTVRVREFDFTEEVKRGVFQPDGRPDNVVITSAGAVKYPKLTLKLRTLTKAEYDALRLLLRGEKVLVLRNFFSDTHFLMVSGDIDYTLTRASRGTQPYPIRHAYEIDVPVHVVARPLVGPVTGALALAD